MSPPRKGLSPDALRMLALLRDAAPGPRSAVLMSTAKMAETLGCSVGKVKTLRRSMIDAGLIEARERTAESGAQLENAYRLTRKGRRALAAHQATAT